MHLEIKGSIENQVFYVVFTQRCNSRPKITWSGVIGRNAKGAVSVWSWGKHSSYIHILPVCNIVLRTVHVTFNLPPLDIMVNMFGNWLRAIPSSLKAQIRVGICAFVWALWNCRNGLVLNKFKFPNVLQVIYRAPSLIRTWYTLLHVEDRGSTEFGCDWREMVARCFFNWTGWRSNDRICDWIVISCWGLIVSKFDLFFILVFVRHSVLST